jgi:hypothetical protein
MRRIVGHLVWWITSRGRGPLAYRLLSSIVTADRARRETGSP